MIQRKDVNVGMIAVIAASLFSLGAITNVSVANAQSEQGSANACGDGFRLEKGNCVKEPVITPGTCPSELAGRPVTQVGETCASAPSSFSPTLERACAEVNGRLVPGPLPGTARCVFPAPLGEPTCDVGVLNEQSGLCETKPGNRDKVK